MTLWSVDLCPLDVTPDEWDVLREHWLVRTDHFGLWALFFHDHFERVEAYADKHPEAVASRTESFITLGGDVNAEARDMLRELLVFKVHANGQAWQFAQLDLRLYCGDLEFLRIHDAHLFHLHAAEPELEFYRAFGMMDHELQPATRWHSQTWTYRTAFGDNNLSPEASQAGRLPLSGDELGPRLADISTRHPVIAMPPFRLAPADGMAGRSFLRSNAQAAALWSEVTAAPIFSQLDVVRRDGAEEALRRLGRLSFPETGNWHAVGAACEGSLREATEAIPGRFRGTSREGFVPGDSAISRCEATISLSGGPRLTLLAHFAATDDPAPDVFAVAYRLEDSGKALLWQYDACPALPTPHKHLPDGSMERMDRLPTPAEVAQEAVATSLS